MKIALLGYGKMGKTIEGIALSRGNEIVLKVDEHNAGTYSDAELMQADVAIEFSTPESAYGNIMRCFRCHVPVVAGTTGWLAKMDEVKKECLENNQAFFYASNFSIGVNIFFRLNENLAKMMNGYGEYDVRMEEIHHIHKLDSPSGTAITLANGIIANLERKSKWIDGTQAKPGEIPIGSKREGEVPGTHIITYQSAVDTITISHEAHNRQGFALGAVVASEWLPGKKGIFGMNDLLGF
ncbi:MAG: 4-hydroxy-tetrahydrodipicolinate reductase [Bacteroidetes bacterium]|nr:MAG: 4-hydroxy-tetrahydrodipicolinate reductase [Bacteroidota bacterium]